MRRRWHCPKCGGRGTAKLEARLIFHPCLKPRQVGIREWDREKDTQSWARAVLGGALEESVTSKYGADALLRGAE